MAKAYLGLLFWALLVGTCLAGQGKGKGKGKNRPPPPLVLTSQGGSSSPPCGCPGCPACPGTEYCYGAGASAYCRPVGCNLVGAPSSAYCTGSDSCNDVTGQCVPGTSPSPVGGCTLLGAPACAPGNFCDSSTGVCTQLLLNGQICYGPSQCLSGVCTPNASSGPRCTSSPCASCAGRVGCQPCTGGYHCQNDGFCYPPLASGSYCPYPDGNSWCQSGVCQQSKYAGAPPLCA